MNTQTKHYSTAEFADEGDADRLAHHLLTHLNGLTVAQARQVINRAEFWLHATTRLDCQATDFQQAVEGYRRVAPQSA